MESEFFKYTLIDILEAALLAGVFIFLIRFVFINYASKIRKPASWLHALKKGSINPELAREEKRYHDRIRFYILWMQIKRINDENIEGDLAELGVYKGETAKVMHLCSPDRKLHLFDTFEGFPSSDLEHETGKAAGYTTQHFADTSVKKVQHITGNHQNIIIHKGYFPDTVKGLEKEKFALVSLDADLYAPTKAGLEFFYPRLSPGGAILVHDHNTDWPELMQAVKDFCRETGETAIPFPDADNTVIIIKSKK